MNNRNSEIERAWEELSFWRDFAVWWKTNHADTNEYRILEALENAEVHFKDVAYNKTTSRRE